MIWQLRRRSIFGRMCTWEQGHSFHNLSAAQPHAASGKGQCGHSRQESVQRFLSRSSDIYRGSLRSVRTDRQQHRNRWPSALEVQRCSTAAEAALDPSGHQLFATPSVTTLMSFAQGGGNTSRREVRRVAFLMRINSGCWWDLLCLMSSRTWHRAWRCFLKRRAGHGFWTASQVSGWCGRGLSCQQPPLHRLAYCVVRVSAASKIPPGAVSRPTGRILVGVGGES